MIRASQLTNSLLRYEIICSFQNAWLQSTISSSACKWTYRIRKVDNQIPFADLLYLNADALLDQTNSKKVFFLMSARIRFKEINKSDDTIIFFVCKTQFENPFVYFGKIFRIPAAISSFPTIKRTKKWMQRRLEFQYFKRNFVVTYVNWIHEWWKISIRFEKEQTQKCNPDFCSREQTNECQSNSANAI